MVSKVKVEFELLGLVKYEIKQNFTFLQSEMSESMLLFVKFYIYTYSNSGLKLDSKV